jgi:phospholipase C
MSRAPEQRIEHVVVLMLENRSFDHMLGDLPGVDGVNRHSPRWNVPAGSSPTRVFQQPIALNRMEPDPKHETPNVLQQIEGPNGLGPMGGFVFDFASAYPDAHALAPQVMAYYGLGKLPALHGLARAFCVCDRWFSSVPGPTWTNRFFMHSGTSQGRVEMPKPPFDWNLHRYDQDTIYDRLNEAGKSWRIYFGDVPQSLLMRNLRRRENRRHYRHMGSFARDVANTPAGEFPAYVFIEPSYLPFGQNDQHPPHDILKGDALIASVYNALRARDEIWDSTLLVVTWDEHGGFYDHVVPPAAVAPDRHAQDGFDFRRYGVRVPAVLVSKWVRPGSVFQPTEGHVDHTSVLRFLSDRFSLGPLGQRVANAASLAGALVAEANESPRSFDVPAARSLAAEPVTPYNENQIALIELSKQLEAETGAPSEVVGARSLGARTGPAAEVEVAKARVDAFLASAATP